MSTKAREVAEECTDLASTWARQWGAYATGVAAKLDGGSYDATAANQDFAAGARLVAQGWMDLAGMWFNNMAILTGQQDEPYPITSGPFRAAAKVGPHPIGKLAMAGPLTAALGGHQIPASAVTFVPDELDSSDDAFVLHLDGNGYDGCTYYGDVIVGGAMNDPVPVEVTVA
jgi:hypothetical protein